MKTKYILGVWLLLLILFGFFGYYSASKSNRAMIDTGARSFSAAGIEVKADTLAAAKHVSKTDLFKMSFSAANNSDLLMVIQDATASREVARFDYFASTGTNEIIFVPAHLGLKKGQYLLIIIPKSGGDGAHFYFNVL